MKRHTLALLLIIPLASCGGGDSSSPTSSSTPPPASNGESCDVVSQNTFVRDALQEFYLWYQELPDPDPAGFPSPEAYLEAVRYQPLDSSYSYIADQAASDAFFSASQFVGVGVSYRQVSATQLRVSQVFTGAPADQAGMRRGDYITSIGGIAVDQLLRTGQVSQAFGPSEVGVQVPVTWRTPQGEDRQAVLTKQLVTIPTVSATATYDQGGSRVGYIFFRNFVEPSFEALDVAFDQLLAEGANDLVLDLRYNGGGRVNVAQHLGSLIGGSPLVGEVFVKFRHNDKNTSRDETWAFETKANALEVPRLVAITTGGSASASEMIINSLRPFMQVTVVGERTFGKPVGQYGFDFCAKTLFPVAFATENAIGEAEYFNGIAADCAAPDDLDHQIADPNEGSLNEALFFLRTGRCSGRASTEAEVQARLRSEVPRRPFGNDPWRQLLGAY